MLAWALRTVALAAKEGMAATKLDGLSALLRGPPAVLWALLALRLHLATVIIKARAMRSAP
jgi:hypothetical protein